MIVTSLPGDHIWNFDCHQHKNEDLADLQRRYDALTARTPAMATTPATPPAAPAPAAATEVEAPAAAERAPAGQPAG